MRQETDYPRSGRILFEILEGVSGKWKLHFRVPGWAGGASVRLNGGAVDVVADPGSYAMVEREWRSGDQVELELAMEPMLVTTHPMVEETRNQGAVTLGPVVYCLESTDLPEGVAIEEVYLPRGFEAERISGEGVLEGLTLLRVKAYQIEEDGDGKQLYRRTGERKPKEIEVTLIPYHAWNNRGEPKMTVWMPLW